MSSRLACIHVPLFPLAARLRSEPELAQQALVVLEGNGTAARITAASRRARRAGTRRGMSLAQARALLPRIAARGRDAACERAAQQSLLETAQTRDRQPFRRSRAGRPLSRPPGHHPRAPLHPARPPRRRLATTHRPEGFKLERFTPPPPSEVREAELQSQSKTYGLLAVRTLRPPIPLEVIIDSQPRRINTPATAIEERRPRIEGTVRIASGPWSLEEEWWTEKPRRPRLLGRRAE